MSVRKRVTASMAARLITTLIKTPMCREDLSATVGLATVTVSSWLREFRAAKLVRVCRWDNDSRGYPTIEVFEFAPGVPDCVKAVLTPAQRQAARRAKAKLAGSES